MKAYRFIILLSVVVLLTCSSCQMVYNKDSYLKEFDKFVEQVEKKVDAVTQEEWREIEAEYLKFTEEYYQEYRDELTENDLRELGRLQGRFLKVQIKSNMDDFEKKVEDVLNQASGIMEGLFE